MLILLCLVLEVFSPSTGDPAHPPGGERQAGLDSLAAMILDLGAIPPGGRLMLLSAFCGWPAGTTSVSFTTGDEQWLGGFSGQCDSWGFAGLPDGRGVLVTSLAPSCIPRGLPLQAPPGGRVEFTLDTALDPSLLTLSAAAPGDGVSLLLPDSEGVYILDAEETGVYWIEASSATASGPEVVMLLPLLCGITLTGAMGPCSGMREPPAATLDDAASALDSIRAVHGLRQVCRSTLLDSIAGDRASDLALAGRVSHGGLDSIPLPPGMLVAENIGRGRGFTEALSMILTSPAHLSSCLSPRWGAVGWGAGVQVERDGWQVVMVCILCEGAP